MGPAADSVWASQWRLDFLPVLGAALVILGAKLLLIERFGANVPFWDQWDAEAALLYKPYLEGTLGWADLFAAHNEHRIFWTRILSLGLLELNGVWSPRLQMLANAILHAAILGLLLSWFSRGLGAGRRPPRGIVLDMDSSVSPTYGDQEGTACNGHFACTCYHPLFVFNQQESCKRRLANRSSTNTSG